MTDSSARVDPRIERTRAHVLAATAALLEEHGAEHATIEAIAEHARVSKSTIYRHWRSRESLLLQALQAAAEAAAPVAADDPATDLAERLTAFAALLQRRGVRTVVFSLGQAVEQDPDLAAELRATLDRHRPKSRERILRLAPHLDTRDADAITDMLTGLVCYRLLTGQLLASDDMRHAVELVAKHLTALSTT